MRNSQALKNMLLVRLGGADAQVVFLDTELDTFLTLALARLNRIGCLTQWTLDEPLVINYFPDVVAGWAASMAWMSKVAPEAGRELVIKDDRVALATSAVAQKLLDLARIEGDTFRLAYDKIAETKRELVPSVNAKWS
jgi:hypothetical protein